MTDSKPEGLNIIRSKNEKIAEALEKGLQIPWLGLRPDIVLRKGTPEQGKETYILDDPVRGLHFELGEAEARFFLCLASENDLKSAVDKLLRTTSLRPGVDDILMFVRMLQGEKLAVLPPELAQKSAETREQKKPGLLKKILVGYLFFKVPLIRPDNFLNAVYPWLSPFWSKPFLFLYAVMSLVGIIFVFQQIELYLNTVNHLFTPTGALAFFLCLTIVKIFHELGHALAARHFGVYVRRIGVAFMVFMPLLYTDTTEAWKLSSRRGRLFIGAAGILVELWAAGVSLFFWSVLSDGILRSLMFYISGASVVSTVFSNLNPLMRFDGYYLLMDYFQINNLRARSTAMFRYYRHRLFVDWQGPMPEEHPRHRSMAVFGFFTMLYRIVIFFSITLTIYHKVFKVLGVILVFMQILLMIMLPLTMEALVLIKNRKYWGSKIRVLGTAVSAMVLIGILFVPLPGFGKLPAMFLYRDVTRVESLGQGKIVTELPSIGTQVKKGDTLLRLKDDNLEQELERLKYDLAQTEASVRNIGSGGKQGGYRKWLLAEQKRLTAAHDKVIQALSHLDIRSPVTGRVLDVNESLSRDSYVNKKNYFLTVGDDRSFEVRAYAPENICRELKEKNISAGHVIFQNLETRSVTGKFQEMLDFPVNVFPNNSLFDYTGGPIVSSMASSGSVLTRQAHYPIIFDIPGTENRLRHGTRCFVRIKQGENYSIMELAVREVWRVLAAEGFL
ncbi:MAG: hypothetical protein GY795_26935 [Desulfobacterales bacterium]|nr:hypothetical protein [Desulfobacterales bacterium]